MNGDQLVRSFRTEAQAEKNWNENIIVSGHNTEDECMAVCDIAKKNGVTLTNNSIKVRRFGKDNKHVEFRFTDRKLKCLKIAKKYGEARRSLTFSWFRTREKQKSRSKMNHDNYFEKENLMSTQRKSAFVLRSL